MVACLFCLKVAHGITAPGEPWICHNCKLADHIEMEHERELAPGTTGLRAMHDRMHESGDHWNHRHSRRTTVWKDASL